MLLYTVPNCFNYWLTLITSLEVYTFCLMSIIRKHQIFLHWDQEIRYSNTVNVSPFQNFRYAYSERRMRDGYNDNEIKENHELLNYCHDLTCQKNCLTPEAYLRLFKIRMILFKSCYNATLFSLLMCNFRFIFYYIHFKIHLREFHLSV